MLFINRPSKIDSFDYHFLLFKVYAKDNSEFPLSYSIESSPFAF